MTISQHYNNYEQIVSNYYERVRDKGSRFEREVRGIKNNRKTVLKIFHPLALPKVNDKIFFKSLGRFLKMDKNKCPFLKIGGRLLKKTLHFLTQTIMV